MYNLYVIKPFALVVLCMMGLNNFLLSQSSASSTYIIQGNVKIIDSNREIRMFRINPVDQSTEEMAATQIDDSGEYKLEYEFAGPDLYRLYFPERQTVLVAIDNGQKVVTVDIEGTRGGWKTIKGSEDSNKLLGYESFRKKSNSKLVSPTYAAMRSANQANDIAAEVDAVEDYVKASKEHRRELLDYIGNNIGTSIALYGTMLRWTGDDEVARLDRLVNAFAIEHPNAKMTRAMQDKVERYKRVAIGVKAPDLSAPTPSGEILSLQDIDAKYILIDFWASWCGPCISQVPDLQKVYADFSDKGFEILSVSLDSKADRWKSAILKHELNWLHISDLKFWKSELAKSYNVTFVPFNLLIDSNGIIVAKNMHSKTLYSKLSELLLEK